MARKLLLMSNSTTHGRPYLEYAKETIKSFLGRHKVSEILFVPYALKDHDAYTKVVHEAFEPMGFAVKGIHTCSCPIEAVNQAKCIFVGGGNTFVLLKTLYEKNLIQCIRKRVLDGDLVYMGSSAGTNVSTPSIHTTNDMPIVYPPSFDALSLVPFNINPHYIDADPKSTHMGETREQRIVQLLEQGHGRKVLGLYEGSLLEIEADRATLKGERGAVLFVEGKTEKERLHDGQDVSHLLKEN